MTLSRKIQRSAPWIFLLSLGLTGCSTLNLPFMDNLPFVESFPFTDSLPFLRKDPPPLHTFPPMKDAEFFDRDYIGNPIKAKLAYQQHDYTTALHESYGLAHAGNADGQYLLGMMFARGEGIPRDAAQARYWFERSATQGNPESQYTLAMMLWQGDYLKQDKASALSWFEKAAKQQHAAAQYFLGRLYLTGSDGAKKDALIKLDQGQAFTWIDKAAKNGYGAAQHNLALMYQYGAGIQQDYAQSLFWFQQAARQEGPATAYDFSHFYQIQSSPYYNSERALYWLKRAASTGHADANREVAALQRQVELGNQSLVLFGSPLASAQRDDLRRTLRKQGGIVLTEPKDGWFDSYDSKDVWNLTDRLTVGYVLESAKVALIQYRLPQADTPKLLAEVRAVMEKRYGPSPDRGERVYSDGIYNEWKVKDTRILLSKGENHALFLSYYVEPAYAMMTQEQLRHQHAATQESVPTQVY